MSASPADRTPGRTPGRTPNGNVPPPRRPREVNPLVQPRRRPRPHAVAANRSTTVGNGSATLSAPGRGKENIGPRISAPIRAPEQAPTALNLIDISTEPEHSGFKTAQPGTYTDYPLVMSKRALAEGIRYHVARFYSKKNIDITNEEEFVRPVRLHRRDARAPAPGSKEETRDPSEIAQDEEREKQDQLRAERDAIREAQMAEVAPTLNKPGSKRGAKAKVEAGFQRGEETEESKAKSKLRYEEALQWHLEDFDNKQAWVGTYEAALSETFAQIVFKDGKFQLVPLEKWYKFNTRSRVRPELLEAVEQKRAKPIKDPDWLVRSREATQLRREEAKNKKAVRGLFVGKLEDVGDSMIRNAASQREHADADELDFEEDFADDEENPIFEGEQEDLKATEARIRRDQLQANFFEVKDEKSYEEAEKIEQQGQKALKLHGKRIAKALMKREKNYIYESDSDNPYSSGVRLFPVCNLKIY